MHVNSLHVSGFYVAVHVCTVLYCSYVVKNNYVNTCTLFL